MVNLNENMAGEGETLGEHLEKLRDCDRKDPKDGDSFCTRGSDAELNDDVRIGGSIEEVKGVNPTGGGAAGTPCEGSQVAKSLEGKSENETSELDGNGATLKTLDEKDIDHREENKTLETEAMSDVTQSAEGQVGISGKIGSHGEQDIEDEEFDAEQRKTTDGKVTKHVSNKSSGENILASYQLPTEKEGEFSVTDLVWGKVRSHPWWPGQIFDPLDSSAQAKKHFKKDRYLVAYFGDRTFAWNDASQLKPFRTHFSSVVKQSNSEAFHNAVDCTLDEVRRRVEFGLACSCIPKDTYDRIKIQIVENAGIQQELSFIQRVDESLNVSSFSPQKLLEYLKTLSEFPTGGFDRLELLMAKAQLVAFYRLKGCSYLPELQHCGGLNNDIDVLINDTNKNLSEVNNHTIHVSKKDVQTGNRNLKAINSSSRKRKHNLKDGKYPEKKKSSLSEPADETPDSTHCDYRSDEVTDNMISPTSSNKRRTFDHCANISGKKYGRKTISLAKVSNITKQSFKIGECIRRVASQLTGPPSMLKCSGNRSQLVDGSADGFSENQSDVFSFNLVKTQKSSLTVPMEYSSLDDLLSLLHWVAQEPMGDYSFVNVIVSFFSDFRNSIIVASDSGKEILPTNKVGTKRKKQPVNESSETFEFDDLSGTYWTDMVIQSGPEEQQSQRSSRKDCQHTPAGPEKPLQVYTRRSYSRKKCSDINHAEVPEKPSGCIDSIDEKSPAELVLNFAELDPVPSEISLNKIFRRFGPLDESETEVDRGSSQARVVFKKCADAEVAFSSAKKFNIFGAVLVNYKLNYTPSSLFKASTFPTTQDQEMHLDRSNLELNTV
ncbi:uncharacterized protein LOC113871304 [Abrus precatorius]|uniref:Uncharacterized protein LOC113871304 n=1 Tax=Abrus precatorius TaxID=3816 RepID=A0A8B8MAM3_ABRPR|nr:uncharacterized protein LOC113871304 [Abrus precatorius]XP_027364134.1 uncharacterized protein LOC113871304 [Abrus precatorius]XP_027364135.1 uncharacterized protein LOC113871304 [Abrus precatorius]